MALDDNIYAVILAGGSGTRFWPKSRQRSPKQLCSIGSEDSTMLEITLDRLEGFIPAERRIIVTHKDQVDSTQKIVGQKCGKFLAEPEARNTANALALAALEIKSTHKKDGRPPIMVSLHADHVIRKVDAFKEAINQAIDLADDDNLTLLGIVPEGPETGYGYIEKGFSLGPYGAKVASFREKPALEIAEQYVASGNFLWNAGIFVWKVDTIIEELSSYLPHAIEKLAALLTKPGDSYTQVSLDTLATTYGSLPKIAIDNAILEVSKRVAVVEADISWQDVGSWDALAKCFPTDNQGNIQYGPSLLIDCKNVTSDSDGDLIACIGLENIVVVKAKGAILVCPTHRAQEVKKVVERLQKDNRTDML